MKPINIKTTNMEVYMRLPGLNSHKEIIFSNDISLKSINKIIKNINKRMGKNALELVPIMDRYVIINKCMSDISLNVYFMNK